MQSPKKRQNLERYITERIKVEKIIPGGQALGTLENGKKIFFWNALPGEIVANCRITLEKASFLEAIALNIEGSAPERVEPKDPCYLSTSPFQIMNYDYELKTKRELLLEMFRQQKVDLSSIIEVDAVAVQTDGKDYFYRNKMEYALYFDHADQQIYPAFRGRGSHRKVPIQQSSIEKPEIFQEAAKIIHELNIEHADARKYQSLLLRANQAGQVSGGLLENHRPHPRFPKLEDQILGRTYSYSPNGFFQINLPVYEMALLEMQKWVQTESVLDLYAGVGTIGLSIARDKNLTLVECNKSAYQEMQNNCSSTTARPVLAKSEEALEYISPDQTVIVDPPRAGCHVGLLEKFLEVLPEAIIYLSCNPITQARDVQILQKSYEIQKVVPYNFFPRTPHLENLVILKRSPNAA